VFDTSKPDGTPQKLLDVSRLQALGWQGRIDLEGGIKDTYRWFLAQEKRWTQRKHPRARTTVTSWARQVEAR
jgi:GDP-L-fucose synthase